MSLKSPILALVFLGVGYVVGLPLGAVRQNASLASHRSDLSDSSEKTPRSSSAPSGKTKRAIEPAAENSLLAKLRALHDREAGGGWMSDWSEFDRQAADLINGYDTVELSALAIQLGQTKKSATPTAVLSAVFMHWARRDAGAAWQAALGALPEHQAEALAACLLATTSTDHLAALKRVDAIKDKSLREQAKQILTDKADRFWQPEAQARRLIAMLESERPKGLLEKTIMSWGSQHLRSALDFVKSLSPSEREALLPDFCMVLTFFDDEEAKRLAASIQDPKQSAQAWKGIVESYDQSNPGSAMALMESLPLEQMDPKFFDRRSNLGFPADAAGRIAARLTGKSREIFLKRAFDNSYLLNGRALQSLLNAVELQPEDGPAIEKVMQTMMQFTPDSALAWADALPESPLRDHAIAEASESIEERDRPRALQMAASVQDEKLRVKTMRSHMESWLQNDRTAAIAWLKSAEGNLMPADERARWLRLSGIR